MLFRRHIKSCPYRRKGRRYYLCGCPVWSDRRINGLRKPMSLGTTDWKEAQEIEQQILAGTYQHERKQELPAPLPQNCNSLTLQESLRRFIANAETRKLHTSTIYKFKLLEKQLLDFVERHGIQLLKDISLEALEAFQAEGKEGPRTSVKKLGRIKSFFRFAIEREWINKNPARLLRGPKVRPNPTLPFTHEEMAKILAAVEGYPDKSGKTGRANAARLRAFILTLRYTGLRISDVTNLAVDRLVGNRIFLYTQKTGQAVNCVLPAFVAEALERAPRLSERYFFWTGNSTLHTAIGSWQRTLRKLFKLAGMKGSAHRFRDTFAVELLLAGVSTEEVAVLLGHSNIGITQKHYSPWVSSRQRQLEANLVRAWDHDPVVLLNMRSETDVNKQDKTRPN